MDRYHAILLVVAVAALLYAGYKHLECGLWRDRSNEANFEARENYRALQVEKHGERFPADERFRDAGEG